MVTMGSDLQPGCLPNRLLTGLSQPQINPRGFFSSPTFFAATGQQPTCSLFPFSAEHWTFSFSF
jgi:hypothetical protein